MKALLAADGERKSVTALFADIKGSTELVRDLDPEEARAIIDPTLKIMVEAIGRYDGYVVQSTGDGIFALFGALMAHEDHPQRALHAALEMQKALRANAERLAARGKPALEARIGVSSGEVVMRTVETGGRVEYTPVGHVSNLAARMQTIAPAGGIVISDDTRRLVEGYFDLRPLEPTEVKGVSGPIPVYEVLRASALHGHFELAARRGLTKFVGRERELEHMLRALALVRNRHGQIVAAVGEAGAGKSRLIYEFKAVLPAECKLLEAYSVSHGKASAYLPVLTLLYRYFDIEETDDKAARRSKIQRRLNTLDPALADTLPLIFALMDLHEGADPHAQMDPLIKRRRTLDAIKRIILRESLNQPTIVLFEDLHWIDGETQALLDLLADAIANARVLLLINYRPEYRHGWSNKSYYSQLRLDALDQENSSAMLATLLGEGMKLNPLKRLIVDRTEGNPFFIEEMVRALFDEGALVRNGVVKVTRSLSELRLPPTVQGILASRIDRLSSERKRLLQTLAVMGREAPLGLIKHVASAENGQLERMLGDLQAGEFIYEQPASADIEYVFKHALTQEVAYKSLLTERRKLLHERTAQALESVFADNLDDHLSELARHYSCSDNVTSAIEYLRRAGHRALRRSAHAEGIVHFTDALSSLKNLPEVPERDEIELDLQIKLGICFMALKGYAAPEVAAAFSRAMQLCRQVEQRPETISVMAGMIRSNYVRGELRAARELSEQCLQIAEASGQPALQIPGLYLLGGTLFFLGEMETARKHLEQSIALYDPLQHSSLIALYGVDPGVACLCYLSNLQWCLGYPDKALQTSEQVLSLAQAQLHPVSLAGTYHFAAMVHEFRREWPAVKRCAMAALDISREWGLAFFAAIGTIDQGSAIAQQGSAEAGIDEMLEGLTAYSALGAQMWRPYFLGQVASAYEKTGEIDKGIAAVKQAIAAAQETNEHWWISELHHIEGKLLLKLGGENKVEATSCIEEAIAIARKQHSKSLELRAATSLARLHATDDRRNEARAVLADIYGWFTEGFETADLKDAKALLDELSS